MGIRSSAIILAMAAGACYSPRLDDCVVSCGADDSCPDGLTCVEGLCRTDGRDEPCPSPSDGGGGGGGDAASCDAAGQETCPHNGVDDDCNGTMDDVDCGHAVECAAFSSPGAAASGYVDALKTPGPDQVCAPGGACGVWLACRTSPAGDGHQHGVVWQLFDNGYSNLTGFTEYVRFNEGCSACTPGGTCRVWFGLGVTAAVAGHDHRVVCETFNDNYTEVLGPTDALSWSCFRKQFLWGGGGEDGYRTWWGRCHIE